MKSKNQYHQMTKNKKILFGIIFFILFVTFQVYTTTSPAKKVNNIKTGYEGMVISKRQIAQRNSHRFRIFSKKENKTHEEVFNQELDSIISIGDSIVKPKNNIYLYVIKPNGQKRKYIYEFIFRSDREDFRWPKEWKEKWPEASR